MYLRGWVNLILNLAFQISKNGAVCSCAAVHNGAGVSPEYCRHLEKLMTRVVDMLGDTIGILDFWKKPVEVKRLRGKIGTELLASRIREVSANQQGAASIASGMLESNRCK